MSKPLTRNKALGRSWDERLFVLVASLVMAGFSLSCLVPILIILGSSFTDELSLLRDGYGILPGKASLAAYRVILGGNSAVLSAYGVSVFVTVVGTALSLVVSVLAAYALSRREFRWRGFFNLVVIFTVLFNAGLVPWYMVCVQVWHLKGSILALILPMVVNGFNIFLLRNYMSQVPEELVEAARMDGAPETTIVGQVMVPMAMPAIVTVGLFYAMGFWNDWFLALMYLDNSQSLFPIQYLLRVLVTNSQFLSQHSQVGSMGNFVLPSEGVKMAACVLAIGPLVLIYLFAQKFFIKGLSLGAVKG